MAAYRIDISLRVEHPSQDLAGLVKRIGIAPSRSWTKGEPRRAPKGKLLGGTRAESYFSIPLKIRRSSSLADALSKSLQVVGRVKRQLRAIVASGGQASLAVGWFCTGDAGSRLPSDLLAELTRSGVDLDLYLYFAMGESQVDD
jgi:hypothetical protein